MKAMLEFISKPIVAVPAVLIIISLAASIVIFFAPDDSEPSNGPDAHSHSHGDGADHSH